MKNTIISSNHFSIYLEQHLSIIETKNGMKNIVRYTGNKPFSGLCLHRFFQDKLSTMEFIHLPWITIHITDELFEMNSEDWEFEDNVIYNIMGSTFDCGWGDIIYGGFSMDFDNHC